MAPGIFGWLAVGEVACREGRVWCVVCGRGRVSQDVLRKEVVAGLR